MGSKAKSRMLKVSFCLLLLALVNIQAKKVLVKTKDGHQISKQIQSTEGAGDSAVTSVHQVKEKKSRGGQDYWLCYLLWACGVNTNRNWTSWTSWKSWRME